MMNDENQMKTDISMEEMESMFSTFNNHSQSKLNEFFGLNKPEKSVSYFDHKKGLHLLKDYVNHNGLIRNWIDSFDYFLENTVPHIIRENSKIECVSDKHKILKEITFEDVSISKPVIKENGGTIRDIYPKECVLKSHLLCDYKRHIHRNDKIH